MVAFVRDAIDLVTHVLLVRSTLSPTSQPARRARRDEASSLAEGLLDPGLETGHEEVDLFRTAVDHDGRSPQLAGVDHDTIDTQSSNFGNDGLGRGRIVVFLRDDGLLGGHRRDETLQEVENNGEQRQPAQEQPYR